MNASLPGFPDSSEDLATLSIIRTETALSRFPIHRLVKKGDVKIEIKNQSSALLWEVTYNSKYGQPGPLAYKLDTLVVNKRIEEAGHPTPRLLRLGSLRDICRELGNSEGGESTQAIRNALLQNASAFINAKITYKALDRTERSLEAGFTRYSVLFTGESLPDGSAADGVYLLLNEPYWQVIDAALTRPLDYAYMHSLPPAAQRFYEIVSYQIYGALLYKNERARLRYSEYCMLSTALRYLTFDQVKKQMYKIHKPHLDSGYLAKIAYEQTTDDLGQLDWWMYYIPGPNASREYEQFKGNLRKTKTRPAGSAKKPPKYAATSAANSGTGTRAVVDAGAGASLFSTFPAFPEIAAAPEKNTKTEVAPEKLSPTPSRKAAQNIPPAEPVKRSEPVNENSPETESLIKELIAADLDPRVAERFAQSKPDECRRQLWYLPFVTEFTVSRGAYLRRAIEREYDAPKAYTQLQAENEASQKKQAEAQQRKALEATRKAVEAAKASRTANDMAMLEKESPEAFLAFEAYLIEQRKLSEKRIAGMSDSIKAKALMVWDLPDKRQEEFKIWREKYRAPEQILELVNLPPVQPVHLVQPVQSKIAPPHLEEPEDASEIRSQIEQALSRTPDSE